MIDEAQEILDDLGVPIDPTEEVGNLSVSYQQMVAVAAALLQEAKVLIIDEATAALTADEIEHLFEWIQNLKLRGLAIVYVSHRIDEIFAICDRVSVLLDGKYVGTIETDKAQRDDLISMMIGDEFVEQFPPPEGDIGDVLLSVSDLKLHEGGNEYTFEVHKGEIVGVFGMVGSGRTEMVRAIFGAERFQSGEVKLNGKKVVFRIPADAVGMGIGLMPEDRKQQGLLLRMSVLENISIPFVRDLSYASVINSNAETKAAEDQISDLRIVTPNVDQEVQFLSGGNQQKVVLAKWLATESELLILDQPTRGIDVRAKADLYQIMRNLASKGHGLIMVSDELPEILGMSDRIIVMHEGRITGILTREDATREKILHLAYDEEVRGGAN
jgi:ribose transport system ATP-binding protein